MQKKKKKRPFRFKAWEVHVYPLLDGRSLKMFVSLKHSHIFEDLRAMNGKNTE